ncbi:MAG: CinA family protein [Tenericutes bacterium]|jgi:PncC family amidohydrolase|nr:CinA family protein [Mycoplasmatota bacterium]
MKPIIEEVHLLAKDIVERCIKKKLKIVFAESMTGGLLASLVTSVPDASKVISESVVVYSEDAKINILNCKKETLDKCSVYSDEVIQEMLDGLKALSNSDIFVAVSGIAGPKTYNDLDVGTVYIGIDIFNKRLIFKEKFTGDRLMIRYKTSKFIFNTIINNI